MYKRSKVGTIGKGTMKVEVNKVVGLKGYEYLAIGEKSIPLAVDLALLEQKRGSQAIEDIFKSF